MLRHTDQTRGPCRAISESKAASVAIRRKLLEKLGVRHAGNSAGVPQLSKIAHRRSESSAHDRLILPATNEHTPR